VALFAFLVWGSGKETGTDRSETGSRVSSIVGGPDSAGGDRTAEQAIAKAHQSALEGTDLDAQVRLWDLAVSASRGTSRFPEATKERDGAMVRRAESMARELRQLEATVESLEKAEGSKKAADFLRSARARHASPEWTAPVDRSLSGVLEREKAASSAGARADASPLIPREGLALWLRGDLGITQSGTRVSRWADQSASHRDARQDASAQQPTLLSTAANGKPGVVFDGARTSMSFILPVNGLRGMTVFVVSACTRDAGASTGSDSSVFYWDAAGSNGKLYLGSFQTAIRFKFGTGQPNGDIAFQRPSPLSTRPSLTVIRKEGPEDTLFTDGVPAARRTGMGECIGGCKDQASLGIGRSNSHFSGCIAELLIFTKPLSDADRQQIERYLMEKYALPSR
jgi:hypothetical protein